MFVEEGDLVGFDEVFDVADEEGVVLFQHFDLVFLHALPGDVEDLP